MTQGDGVGTWLITYFSYLPTHVFIDTVGIQITDYYGIQIIDKIPNILWPAILTTIFISAIQMMIWIGKFAMQMPGDKTYQAP